MELGSMIAGRYRLDERLAAGGMGEVWRGTDTRLNRTVAVKLLHSGLSSNDRFRARFHQEAQAVAQLQSPGIVALYDYGEEDSPEGVVSYLIMELVRGKSLAAVIKERGRLSPAETMKIMATSAEALAVAHQAHIIHRDIKPANLLADDDLSVKIVDFGIAAGRAQAGLTETGTVMGTIAYASPEQLQGAQLTGGTDIYSLGIVAYECLAGRPPFASNEPTAAITGHLTGTPAPLPPDVPHQVAQIVLRCLAKDPRQRFGSAAELAQVCRSGGSGTTAILPPANPSPATGTRPIAGAMAPGMAPGTGNTGTQVMGQGNYNSPPPNERPLPPPREPEEPRRGKAVPVLLTLAIVLLLIVGLVFWQPWNRPADTQAEDGPSESASADDAGAASPEEDEESTRAAEDENQGGGEEDTQDGGEDNSDEETTDDSEEGPETATLPNYVGSDVNTAISELEGLGFTQVTWNYPAAGAGNPVTACEVVSQSPEGDQEVPLDEPINLEYLATEGDECPEENYG